MIGNTNSPPNTPPSTNSSNWEEIETFPSGLNSGTPSSNIFTSSIRSESSHGPADSFPLRQINATVITRDSHTISTPWERPVSSERTIDQALAVLEDIISNGPEELGTVADWQQKFLSRDLDLLNHMSTPQLLHLIALERKLGPNISLGIDRHQSIRPFLCYKMLLAGDLRGAVPELFPPEHGWIKSSLSTTALFIQAIKHIARSEDWSLNTVHVALAQYINIHEVDMRELFKLCSSPLLSEQELRGAAIHLSYLDFSGIEEGDQELAGYLLSCCKENLTHLNIAGTRFLETLPPLPNCTSLDITGSNIRTLPPELPTCQSFKFAGCDRLRGKAPAFPLCESFEFDDSTLRALDSSFVNGKLVFDEEKQIDRIFFHEQIQYLNANLFHSSLDDDDLLWKNWETQNAPRLLGAVTKMSNAVLFPLLGLISQLKPSISHELIAQLVQCMPRDGLYLIKILTSPDASLKTILNQNWPLSIRNDAISTFINSKFLHITHLLSEQRLSGSLQEIIPKLTRLNLFKIQPKYLSKAEEIIEEQKNSLIQLDISDSEGIIELPSLALCRTLYMNETGIETLPYCPELRNLYCEKSMLTKIPQMDKLTRLYCTDSDYLTALGSFPKLEDFEGMYCTDLKSLGAMPACKTFNIEACDELTVDALPIMPYCHTFEYEDSGVRLPLWEIDPDKLKEAPLRYLIQLGENYLLKGWPLPQVVFKADLGGKNERTLLGEDIGGLLRDVLAQLSSWINDSGEALLEDKLPDITPAQRMVALRTIGKLMTICAGAEHVTGCMFNEVDFRTILDLFQHNRLRASATWISGCPEIAELVSTSIPNLKSRFANDTKTLHAACSMLEEDFQGSLDELYQNPIETLSVPGRLEEVKGFLEAEFESAPLQSLETIAQTMRDSAPSSLLRNLPQADPLTIQFDIEGTPVNAKRLLGHLEWEWAPSVTARSVSRTKALLRAWIQKASPEMLSAFVQFASGARSLDRHKIIISLNTNDIEQLPVSHTCAYTIEISAEHVDEETFNAKLNLAIREGMGFETA